jgi:hypothetical protein
VSILDNNERLVIDDDDLSSILFEKVKPYLPQTIEVNSTIQTENGLWTLSQLNNRLRFCKYSANQYFHRHLDGIHYRSETEQSKLTFMIYLNNADEFEGGRTLFYQTKDSKEIWAAYIPQKGDLIVFDHNVWHEGEELKRGEKFVLRSDILYSKTTQNTTKMPFEGHLGYVWKILQFDENVILSGGRDKEIKNWDREGNLTQSLGGHQNSILCIEKMNDTTFISGSRDKQIKVWKREGNQLFRLSTSINIHTAVVLSLARLPDNLFASSGGDNTIKICNLSGDIQNELVGHSNWVWQVIKLSPFHLASCSEDSTIKIWDYRKSEPISTFSEKNSIICLAYDNSSKTLISGNLQGEIVFRELEDNFREIKIKKINAHQGIVRTILQINKNFLASGGEDNKVKIWNIETEECIVELEHQNFVQSLLLTNKNTLLSASYDGTIREWALDL